MSIQQYMLAIIKSIHGNISEGGFTDYVNDVNPVHPVCNQLKVTNHE